jgi:CHAD domain-containing protein
MSFELHRRKHIDDELRSIARRELRRASDTLSKADPGAFSTGVHEARKRAKKVRAVLEVIERSGGDVPGKDRKRLERAARELSALRDSAAIIETFEGVRRRYPKRLSEHTYGILRRGLVQAREERGRRARRDGVASDAAGKLDKTRKAAKRWAVPAIDLSQLIVVATNAYGRSRKAMQRARETGQSATLHRWRKRVMMLWYQLRLVKPLTTGVASLVADLKRLETELGEDHNLVVLGATLRSCRDLRSMRAEVRQIEQLAVRMRQPLRKRVFALGSRSFRRKRSVFGRWLRRSSKQKRRQTAAA